jgi:hypothetical protein
VNDYFERFICQFNDRVQTVKLLNDRERLDFNKEILNVLDFAERHFSKEFNECLVRHKVPQTLNQMSQVILTSNVEKFETLEPLGLVQIQFKSGQEKRASMVKIGDVVEGPFGVAKTDQDYLIICAYLSKESNFKLIQLYCSCI